MLRRPSLLSNVLLALAVLVFTYAAAYVYSLQQKIGGNHMAVNNMCAVDESLNTTSNQGHISDVYVNCSGFQS